MRIAEISSQDPRPPTEPNLQQQQQQQILSRIETLIKQIETNLSPPNLLSSETTIPSDLRQTLTHLSRLLPLSNPLKLQIWKLSYRLWNSCVDISNAASLHPSSTSLHASLRHVASDLLSLAVDVSGVPSPSFKCASFYLKTGLVYHDRLLLLDLASSCFETATEILSKIENLSKISCSEERRLLLDLNLARSRTAWELLDRNLAITLLNRSKNNLLFGTSEHYKLIANQFLDFGKKLLSLKKDDSDNNNTNNNNFLNEALKLINEALDMCEKGLGFSRTKEEIIEIKELRSKALRFISAVHLQKGEYESVIKCVRVLREGGGSVDGDHHASLPVLAMKAWLGLGKYAEAEKELRGMVVNKGVPEGVWVGAVEDYFEAAGNAGAETAKGVFLGLLGRCHVSAGAAVRVVRRVVAGRGGGEGLRVRAPVVAELVSDERVLALFEGERVGKERKAMHAVLWDCASENFRLKEYKTSAEMFEKSLLYIPHNVENRNLRAKGFRVMCLCYLGLSQYDRAQEYINEAEKLEPNIACAFLKFKIYLQTNNNDGAINQIEAMSTCLDFFPEFLLLSAHEAVACQAFPVAVASLSNLLKYYSSGKSMPTTEVVVLRTLVMILSQEPQNETEILKFMKLAHARASELGTESFYGKGQVGRREQNWFAVTSWNLGTKCGKEKKYELSADFFRLASEMYDGSIGEKEEQNCVMVCKSLILAVSALIATENQKNTSLTDSEVKESVHSLDKAEKILTSISTRTQLDADKTAILEPQLFFMYAFVAYDIHGRLDTFGSRQQLIVKNFASSKACSSKYLLQLGLIASQGQRCNPEVAIFALQESLTALLSSPSPDYHDVALILRRLISIASIHKGDSDDEGLHNMYKQAYRIMVGLNEGEYPAEEGKWLAMTAWNRGALPMRMGQIESAKRWMNMGLELARKVVGMETYRACMEDSLTAYQNYSLVQKQQLE